MKRIFLLVAFLLAALPGNATPLVDAVSKGNKELVRKLLGGGANPNEALDDGTTPLLKAVEKQNEVIVAQLLSKGANIDAADNNGITPLLKAASLKNAGLVKLFIGKKANVNAQGKSGTTALFYFAEDGNKELVSLLLKKGANPNIVNGVGNSATRCALVSNKQPVMAILIPLMDKDNEREPVTPLILASYVGDEKKVRALLGSGIEANKANAFGETALIFAVKRRHTKIVEALVENGASAVACWKEVYPLFREGNTELGKLIVRGGADVNAQGDYNYTALMEAKDEDTARFLLERGANPNARCVEGFTPLMLSARRGHMKIVELMLNSSGVDVNQSNNHGDTALSLCITPKTSKKLVEILLNAGAKPLVGSKGGRGDAIAAATRAKNMEVKALLEKAAQQ